MKNPTTVWNGESWETLEREDAMAREEACTGQIVDINVGAQDLWTKDQFRKAREMLKGAKPKAGTYKTTDMKAVKK
jgi:hypothetical protein